MIDTADNYIALAACILSDKSPDAAFRSVFGDRIDERSGRPVGPVNKDAARMIEMYRTMTYEQVGREYGISAGAVFCRIKRYKERLERQA
jgi:hypothetical protein